MWNKLKSQNFWCESYMWLMDMLTYVELECEYQVRSQIPCHDVGVGHWDRQDCLRRKENRLRVNSRKTRDKASGIGLVKWQTANDLFSRPNLYPEE